MIKPKALRKGDTIGVISPAGPITGGHIKHLEDGLMKLKNLGYKIVLGHYIYNSRGYLAGNDVQRAYDLMQMFARKDVQAIFCSRGGYGTERLVDFLNIDIIKENPKILAGFSNITFLLNLFYQSAGLITFHGPMIRKLGTEKEDCNLDFMLDVLTEKRESFEISVPTSSSFNVLVPGKSTGILVGGNLTTLISTLGTKYEIDTNGRILLLEDVDEPAYAIDRMLTLLKNSGKLDRCLGIILGEFTNCEDSCGRNVDSISREIICPLGKPAVHCTAIGHGRYNITLPVGALVKMDTAAGSIRVLEPVVC